MPHAGTPRQPRVAPTEFQSAGGDWSSRVTLSMTHETRAAAVHRARTPHGTHDDDDINSYGPKTSVAQRYDALAWAQHRNKISNPAAQASSNRSFTGRARGLSRPNRACTALGAHLHQIGYRFPAICAPCRAPAAPCAGVATRAHQLLLTACAGLRHVADGRGEARDRAQRQALPHHQPGQALLHVRRPLPRAAQHSLYICTRALGLRPDLRAQ